MKLEFSRQVFETKKIQIQIFTTIRAMGTKLFLADRQTDGLLIAFRKFCERA
jgi:hypothetical protein